MVGRSQRALSSDSNLVWIILGYYTPIQMREER
jgi:hypothetical protein